MFIPRFSFRPLSVPLIKSCYEYCFPLYRFYLDISLEQFIDNEFRLQLRAGYFLKILMMQELIPGKLNN